MTLLFSGVHDILSFNTFINLINKTESISKVIVIKSGEFNFNFNRDIKITIIEYESIFRGDYSNFSHDYILDQNENNFYNKNYKEVMFMMNRIHRFYSYSFSDRDRLYSNHIKGVIGLFNKLNPDFCLFTNMPHEVFDFIIYKLAEYRKISIRYLMHGMQMETYYQILEKIKENDPRLRDYKEEEDFLNKDMNLLLNKFKNPDYQHFYMKSNYEPPSRRFTGFKKYIFKLQTHLNFLKEIYKKNKLLKYLFVSVFYHYVETFNSKSLLKKYGIPKLENDTKYIYVPLHYQPELTTSPMGGNFYDQIEMIDLLDRNCPNDYKIVVKEHPKQKINFGRDYIFYEKLLEFKNIIFLNKSISNKEIFKLSEVIATISGTVGFEAICHGKPVLVFGEPFYMHYKSSIKINDDSDFLNYIKNIDQTVIEDDSQLNKFLNNCEKYFHYGFMNMEYSHLSNLTLEENTNRLVINIKNSFNF